jgi:uncharacterized surface protein with fasciclin (FAS1) repeats
VDHWLSAKGIKCLKNVCVICPQGLQVAALMRKSLQIKNVTIHMIQACISPTLSPTVH